MIYIFDIDGTIADITHRLHFIQRKPSSKANWREFFKACVDDKPIEETIVILRALWTSGNKIVLITGRSDEIREETMLWLYGHRVPYTALYMRKQGDYREDTVLKSEILDSKFPTDWARKEIAGVFEDKQRVVDMFRARGLRVYQVAADDKS